MKRYLIFLAAMFCAVISCSQEDVLKTDDAKLVRASIFAESGIFESKTTATWNSGESKYNIRWEADDALSVFTESDTDNHMFTAIQTGKVATFTGELPETAKNIYPIMPYNQDAYISGSIVYTSVPTEQDGDFYNVVLAGWPKPGTRAGAEKDFLCQFEAVSGIIKFTFDHEKIADYLSTPQHVVRLSITADRPIAGDAKISFGSGTPVMTADPNGTGSNMYNTISISAPDGAQSLHDGDYYIATLPIKKDDFPDGMGISVKCETKEGEVAYINATIGGEGNKHILTANVVKNIGTVKTTNYVPHFTSGQFTVNYQGLKVSFSPGNLQYRASDSLWRFALNQYDAQGEVGNLTQPELDNVNARSTQSEWIDLFPWGHSGFEYNNIKYVPYQAIPIDNQGLYLRSQTGTLTNNYANGDWGKYCSILNGNHVDEAGTWRLLTYQEFYHLAYNRNCNKKVFPNPKYSGSLTNNFNFLKCGIDTGLKEEGGENIVRYGVMLFPDGFTWPESFDIPGVTSWNCAIDYQYLYNENSPVYSLTDFAIFESKGVVFLPAAGQWHFVDGMSEITMVNPGDELHSFNIRGDYWTTDKMQSMTSYTANVLQSDGLGAGTNLARSVRLVKNN